MDVSVVIPCLNREQFIDDAISSALSQGENVEIIVVDDGSTDQTWERVQAYGARVVAIRGEGRGASAARNRGLAAARGRFVHFLDSDDRLAPAALPAMLDAAESLDAKSITVGDSVNIDAEGRPTGGPTRGYAGVAPAGEIPRSTILARPMSTPLPLFPIDAVRSVGGFDERLRHFEDRELTVRLLTAGYTFVHVPIVISEVREHQSDRLSASACDSRFEHMASALMAMNELLLQDPVFAGSKEERTAFGRLCWSAARDASRAGCAPVANRLFDLASTVAGADAQNAHWLVRMLYKVMKPYSVERWLQAVKRAR